MKIQKLLLPLVPITAITPAIVLTNCSCNKNNIDVKLSVQELAKQCLSILAGANQIQSNGYIDIPKALKQVDVIFENLENPEAVVVTTKQSEKSEYTNQLHVKFETAGSTVLKYEFDLFFNDVTTRDKSSFTKQKLYTSFEGICVLQDLSEYPFQAKIKSKSNSEERELEYEFKLFKNASLTNYLKLEFEKEYESKKSETEYEYKYELVQSGTTTYEYKIKIEIEDSKTKVKLELENPVEEKHKLRRYKIGQEIFFTEDEGLTYQRTLDQETGEVVYVVVQ